MAMRSKARIIVIFAAVVVFAALGWFVYDRLLKPTEVLVVNPLPAQAAEIMLNNDSRHIRVTCKAMDEVTDFGGYDAVLMYGRGLYLDSLQMESLESAARKGIPVFTNTLRNYSFIANHNLDSVQIDRIDRYFKNPCHANYSNLLRYVRSIATPGRLGDMCWDEPVEMPNNMFYHLESGRYFKSAGGLTDYLKESGLYNEGGDNVAFVSGVNFPVEGNRAHIDTLVSRLTRAGYNVYPISATGPKRARMLREVEPRAVVYLPMGRLGNDSLIDWTYGRNIPLFMPFPLIQPREEWLDVNNPMGAGTLNARIVMPEIDGAMAPLCISTQDESDDGYIVHNPVAERIDGFMEQFTRFMNLRYKSNASKRIAIGYFKTPGKDALLASGMEVVPSLYNFLKRLRAEGYDVSGLPATLSEFKRQVMTQGMVTGAYAEGAQERFMDECDTVWIDCDTYEGWAKSVLLPEKYAEVESRYGKAPGALLSRGDSLAVVMLRYGNIMLFPQPRPALGDDEFKLVHGMEVPPPHSYLAPYLYMQKEFDADALIHFGTHGNLEFTPGKNVGLSQADWAEVLIGNRPHFYYYTTANVGEAVIAKRRSHAVIVTHLTPPFVESGLRQKYSGLIESLHEAIANPSRSTLALKRQVTALGLHRDLALDSASAVPYTVDELKKIDSFAEELCNEKVTGAYYTLGETYSQRDMLTTIQAILADRIAYGRARADRDKGRISTAKLQDYGYLAHHYLPAAKKDIATAFVSGGAGDVAAAVDSIRDALVGSTVNEMDAMVGALAGVPVRPAPGGDPVLNSNVLPTGRNMYSINAEATPGPKAWTDGVALAEKTLEDYVSAHGEYPRKVAYSFWAGEFISSQGATIAQALRMLGVEPVRDEQGRVMDLKLTPSEELGRPRVNIVVQVSGQLRDIAASRLRMLTDAVRLASEARDDVYPNYVADGTTEQEKALVAKGASPKRARELSTMRVFGPVNSGYSTGMLSYTESSGDWDDRQELVDGYINNMCAMYGDEANWGQPDKTLMTAAIDRTAVVVQPRQSNTWGPVSLDHVYEFAGAISLAAKSITGTEPDAVMADYRNSYVPRMQNLKEAVAVETRATVLNPEFVRERMKGDATTAQMFGEIFRNIFGWSVMRQSALNDNIYDDLYDMYVMDVNGLGVQEYFERVNPAALQEMTATMLESARKGYWKPSPDRLAATAALHAAVTERHGAPCTEFVCDNRKLQQFIASSLDSRASERYQTDIENALSARSGGHDVALRKESLTASTERENLPREAIPVGVALVVLIIVIAVISYLKNRRV